MPALARTSADFLDAIHADVWHAHALSTAPLPVLATGDAALDAQLPGGGWPVGALTEILQPPGVHSEWRLLLPALARSSLGNVVLVGAPHLPFAPALAAQGLALQRMLWVKAQPVASRLWACEQALRCAEVHAVLAWLPQARSEQLRRLQMAASDYSKLLFVMRPEAAQDEASPAVLRLHVQPQSATPTRLSERQGVDGLHVHVLKRRGPPLELPVQMQARASPLNLLLAAQHALDRNTARA
jgi:protein ImuA